MMDVHNFWNEELSCGEWVMASDAEAEIDRLTAALAESEASNVALIERAAELASKAFWSSSNAAAEIHALATEDQTAALAAYVKQAVKAETRACAEICDGMDSWESPRAVNRAILARLGQPAREA